MSCLDLDDAEARRIAEPMMDDVMQGLAERDYVLHTRHFSVNLKGIRTPEVFASDLSSLGDAPGDRELHCVFRKPKSFTLIWDQAFAGSEGQTLALMTVALKGGRYFVDHFLLH